MPSHNEYFNKYVAYFPTIGKQVKLGRGGTIQVIDKSTKEVITYRNWDEVNEKYRLFPFVTDQGVSVTLPPIDTLTEEQLIIDPKESEEVSSITCYVCKYWTFGHPTRYKELIKKFGEMYDVDVRLLSGFNKPDWVYYFDSHNFLISTNNSMVVDLLQNSSDWVQYKLPELKKFTKEDIAGMIGMSVDSFEII